MKVARALQVPFRGFRGFLLFSFFFFSFSFEFARLPDGQGIWNLGLGTCSAQTAGIFGSTNLSLNTTGVHANSFAIFDISSTTKGLLIPRMTTAQRNVIGAGAGASEKSLLIFNTTTSQYEYWDGAAWVGIATTAAAGWSLTGNSGTTDGTNFIGNTDNIPFNIRVNNQRSGYINSTNQVTFFGYQAGLNNSGATSSTAFGDQALKANIIGVYNTAIGQGSLFNNTGNRNTALGQGTLNANTVGYENTATGLAALQSNISGFYNTASGAYSLLTSTGNNNTAYGAYSLYSNVGGSNATAIGTNAMGNAFNGAGAFTNFNVALGYEALRGSTTASANTGNNNTALGYQTLWSNTSGTGNIAIGQQALYTNTTGNYNTAGGRQALSLNTTGSDNTAFGNNALYANTTGSYNTASGEQALELNTKGGYNTATGFNALVNNTTASQNTAIGYTALGTQSFSNGSAWNSQNVAIGYQALYANQPTSTANGIQNTALGVYSLVNNSTGYYNTASGYASLNDNTTGFQNTAFGYMALSSNTTGSNNTAIGYGANVLNVGLSNATAIGYNSKVNASNTLILGGTGADAVNVGIGTTAPTKTFSVAEKFQVDVNGNIVKLNNVATSFPAANANGVLTNDGTGTLTWTAAAAAGWSLTGNSGTVDGTNFIGTTDNIPFNIRVNNFKAGRISPADNLFLGYLAGSNSNVTVIDNIAIGDSALYTQSFATAFSSQNVAIGNSALFLNNPTATTNGYQNTAIGNWAIRNNTTGKLNTAIGYSALYTNTTGQQNTASGNSALYSNITGNYNTASGVNALYSNVSGIQNTANGFQALFYNVAGHNATAIGYNAMLYANNTATAFTNFNVAVGFEALRGSTTASANTGNYNTSVGYQTLSANTSGSQNTANGFQALNANTTGNYNTAVGLSALLSNTTGSNNTAIGLDALQSTTGGNNTGLGYWAGQAGTPNTTGSNNTFIGYFAQANANNYTNATAIGANAVVGASNAMVLGGTGADAVNVGIGTTAPTKTFSVAEKFQVDVNGNIVKLNNVTTSFPSAQGAASTVLQNDGSGTLSWTTSGTLTGGATNYIPVWTSATALSNSNIYYDGTNVGIGTTVPAALLDINPVVFLSTDVKSIRSSINYNGGGAMANWYGTYIAAPTGIGIITNKYALVTEVGAGNVGIGTTAPVSNLHVVGVSGANNSGITANGNMHLTDGTGNVIWTDAALSFSTGGWNERMRILSTGNVGIGTNAPAAFLQINPTVTASADVKNFQSGIVYNSGTAMTNWYGSYIAAPTGTGTITNKYALVTEAGAGNVGIGTTAPDKKLTVKGGSVAIENPSPGDAIVTTRSGVANESATFGWSAGGFAYAQGGTWAGTTQSLIFQGGGGNVGIGTTTPLAILDIVNDGGKVLFPRKTTTGDPAGINGSVYYNSFSNKFRVFENSLWVDMIGAGNQWALTGNTLAGGEFFGSVNAQDVAFRAGGAGAGFERMRITSGGNVGIGTNAPAAFLQINPTVTASADVKNFQSGIVYNSGTAMTNWYGSYIAAPTGTGTITNKYALVTEAGAGNVGIGTTNPGTKLDVTGDIRASSTITAPMYSTTTQTLTDGATITWTASSGLNAKVTLAGNRTLAISGAPTGSYGTLVVTQDATGSRTLAMPAGSKVNNAATPGVVVLSTAANAIDILTFYYDGTTYYWSVGLNYK